VPRAQPWSEQAFGQKVVKHLTEDRWDVYQEVQVHQGGPVADIVATCGPLVLVCELKRSLNLTLLAQASYWRRWAHLVQVFIPTPKRSGSTRDFALEVCRDKGIGVMSVAKHGGVREWVPPALRRTPMAQELRQLLSEEHKQHAQAGSATGGHWTPFKRTVQRLTDLVRTEPGISMKEAFTRIDHHYASYASARARISALVDRGVINGIEVRREGRKLSLFPT